MAAWLAYLKSRLLIPAPEEDEEPSGAEMAAALKFQLQRLEAMQNSGQTPDGHGRAWARTSSRAARSSPFVFWPKPILQVIAL